MKKKKQIKKPSTFGIPDREKEFVIENIALLLSAGVTITDALNTVVNEVKSKNLKKVLEYILLEVDAGSSFSKSLTKTGLYQDHIIHLIRLGEESGRLSENLSLVAEEAESSRSFKSKVRSAMAYPIIVLVIAVLVGTGIAWFVLPKLSQIFSGMDMDLPKLTQIMISLGENLKQYGYIVVPSIWGGLALLSYILFGNKKTKIAGQVLLTSFPGVSSLIKSIELNRFGFVMGTLLEAGLPLVTSIDFLIESTTLKQYEKFYTKMRADINNGASFKNFFEKNKKNNKVIPMSVTQMIVAGEKSGNLSMVFSKIGNIYKEKAELATKNLPTIIEPLLLLVVWFVVLFVALAVIMPIYGLLSGLE